MDRNCVTQWQIVQHRTSLQVLKCLLSDIVKGDIAEDFLREVNYANLSRRHRELGSFLKELSLEAEVAIVLKDGSLKVLEGDVFGGFCEHVLHNCGHFSTNVDSFGEGCVTVCLHSDLIGYQALKRPLRKVVTEFFHVGQV